MSHPIEDFAPEWGIVLGSGLGTLDLPLTAVGTMPYAEIPELPSPAVPGHPGRFSWGMLAGRRMLVARGRVHLYEGHAARTVTAGIRCMAAWGVRQVILTNAAGSLNPAHAVGGWMGIEDHLNLTGATPLLGGPNFSEMNAVYSQPWRAHFAAAGSEAGVPIPGGVYAGVLGPQYETPAEVRMLRTLGADAVGMSTVLEAIEARAQGMEVIGFSCLTNRAAGLAPEPLRHEDVLAVGRTAGAALARVLLRGLEDLS